MGEKKERLKKLILHILSRVGRIPKVKLAKLILFSEIEHFNKTGDSITGLYFVRMKNGPLIAFFDQILDENTEILWKKETEDIPIREEGRIKKQYLYSPLTEENDLPVLVKNEVDIVIKKYGRKSGTALSRLSHSLPAWEYSEPHEPIYIAELATRNKDEYFALIDLLEDMVDENDASLEEKISRALSEE